MKKTKLTDGFTLVETLVALLITVSFSGAILFGISRVIKIYEKVESEVKINAELNLMARSVERSIEKIKIPFWENTRGALNLDNNTMNISYFEGIKENKLEIQLDPNGLQMTEPEKEPHLFSNLNEGNLDWFYKNRQIAGISITLTLKSSPLTVIAPFGGVPVRSEVRH